MNMNTARIFKNGRSQAVRLPKDFRLEGNQATITRLGDAIVLQPIRTSWLDVYYAMSAIPDFMETRIDPAPEEREDF